MTIWKGLSQLCRWAARAKRAGRLARSDSMVPWMPVGTWRGLAHLCRQNPVRNYRIASALMVGPV